MQHVERVRYVAGNYGGVQGLRVVPLGVWFLLVAVGESGYDATGWLPMWGIVGIYLGLPVVAFVLWALIGLLYERAFGRVLGDPPGEGAGARPRVERAARVVFVVLGLLAALASPPVWLFGPTMAWALLVFWRSQRRFGYHHYAALSAAALLLGVLSAAGLVPVVAWKAVDLAVVGVTLTVGGVFDHLLLTGTMRPVPEEDRARAV